MEFRIGVNLGDVVVEGEQIYGDGVNVAARLESVAEPGSIYVSASIHEQVSNKLDLVYEDLGEQYVKNITKPVRVFRVLPSGTAPTFRERRRFPRKYWHGGVLSLAGLAIALTTFVLVQHVSLKPPHTNASIPPPRSPTLSLPDKPSIAVLPFTNMSGDREQEYFSDGITDDLITALSRLPGLFVIARNSTFTYKGKAAPLQQVSRQLGVKYVLEGSVRKAAGQVRITAQLADATSGEELWAERYDRPLRDIFALQDEIVRRIVTTLNLQLALSQQGVLIPRSTKNLEAYDDLLRGVQAFLGVTKNGNLKARQMFEKAIELDPKYALAYADLGWNYYFGRLFGWEPDPNGMEKALQIEQQAVALDDSLATAHSALGVIYMILGPHDEAIGEIQRGIALDPNSANGYLWLADILNSQWKPATALDAVETTMRRDPRNLDPYLVDQGVAYTMLGRPKEAIPAFKNCLVRFPDEVFAHSFLGSDYSFLGDEDGARREAAAVERHIAASPNSAGGYLAQAIVLNSLGEPAADLVAVDKGMRDPHARFNYPWWSQFQGLALTLLGRPKEAIPALKRHLAGYPDNFWAHAYLAVDYMELGRGDAARAEAAEAVRLYPQFTVEMVFPTVSLQRKAFPAEIDRFRADLRTAGLK
jgi:adenylate cyclase